MQPPLNTLPPWFGVLHLLAPFTVQGDGPRVVASIRLPSEPHAQAGKHRPQQSDEPTYTSGVSTRKASKDGFIN